MKKYEVLDVSGDIGLKAYGTTLTEAFINIAAGTYSLITDPDAIEEKKAVSLSVESPALDGLLVSWLNEVIFYFDTYGFIGKKIVIDEFPASLVLLSPGKDGEVLRLKAVIYGEDFDPERHEGKILIKAATYHRLKVEKKDALWEIDVIFDI